jgi:hypothetical protein
MVQQGDGFTVSTIHCFVATVVQAWQARKFVDLLLWLVFSRQQFDQYHTLCCWHSSSGMACAKACFCFPFPYHPQKLHAVLRVTIINHHFSKYVV